MASVIASVAVWGVTATVFFLGSELVGNFLMFPSIGLTAVAVWHASTITYRKMAVARNHQIAPLRRLARGRDLNSWILMYDIYG